jgi:hypothetical protein
MLDPIVTPIDLLIADISTGHTPVRFDHIKAIHSNCPIFAFRAGDARLTAYDLTPFGGQLAISLDMNTVIVAVIPAPVIDALYLAIANSFDRIPESLRKTKEPSPLIHSSTSA